MPIEIKELNIRINVNENDAKKTSNNNAPFDIARIVELSVEQMAEVLKQQKER